MEDDLDPALISAHISFDRLLSALASISIKDTHELETFKNLLEKKIPDLVSDDEFIESQTLYFVLKNVHQALKLRKEK